MELGGKWGYVDKAGNLAIPIHQVAHVFSEGLAAVELDGKWRYIDPNGRAVFQALFDSAMPFCGGLASLETFQTIGKTTDVVGAHYSEANAG